MTLTFDQAQRGQPWTVPYSEGVRMAADALVPHLLASHVVLHAAKSVGKLAAVYEALDHNPIPTLAQQQAIRDMAADLVAAALRLANLYGFSIAGELARRVEEKNGIPIADAGEVARELLFLGQTIEAWRSTHPGRVAEVRSFGQGGWRVSLYQVGFQAVEAFGYVHNERSQRRPFRGEVYCQHDDRDATLAETITAAMLRWHELNPTVLVAPAELHRLADDGNPHHQEEQEAAS